VGAERGMCEGEEKEVQKAAGKCEPTKMSHCKTFCYSAFTCTNDNIKTFTNYNFVDKCRAHKY
jgi:hypothetical protein